MSDSNDDATKDLQEALNLYDCVVDIDSIKYLKRGWDILGNPDVRYKDWEGRVIAFVGTFKSGKTWLISRILGVMLRPDTSFATPGLCIKVPPGADGVTSEEAKKEPVKKATGGPMRKTRGPVTPKKQEQKFASIIALDTAGTDRPSFGKSLKDMRATEFFLRDLILAIAPRAIFVTAKYDRPTQISIASLIAQLSKEQRTRISSQNKLLVVHNYRDISTEDQLNFRIAEVRDTYERPEEDEEEWLDDEDDDMESSKAEDTEKHHPWLAVDINGYTVFDTPKTTHFFLVNDEAPKDGSFDPREYNNRAIEALKLKVLNDHPKRVNLINAVLANSQLLLQKYIDGWEDFRLRLSKEKDGDRILPCALVRQDEDEVLNPQTIAKWEWEIPHVGDFDDKFWRTPFKTPKVRFTDTGIISNHYHELYGEVFFNERLEKVAFCIETPHFNNNHRHRKFIRVEKDMDKKTIGVFVNLNEQTPISDFTRGAKGFRTGLGVFQFDLSTLNMRYEFPKKHSDIYTDEYMKIENGVLTITLGMESGFRRDESDQE